MRSFLLLSLLFLAAGCSTEGIVKVDGTDTATQVEQVAADCTMVDEDQDGQAEEWGGFVSDEVLSEGVAVCSYTVIADGGVETTVDVDCTVEDLADGSSWVGVASFNDRIVGCSIVVYLD